MPKRQTLDVQGRVSRSLRDFGRQEDGSLVLFALFLFLLMVMMGGIAVDAMRYEQRRTALQSTLDRSTLAAASMTQDLDPESVVRDYFDKEGLTPYLTRVTVTEGMNFRNVKAQARANAEPFFMHMIGIEDFQAKAVSVAEQRINNVEIVLVLDVSGSMNDPMTGGGTKIAALRNAAKEFVSTVLAKDSEKKISIAIVPYNGQVNLGTRVKPYFTLTNVHGRAGVDCVDLPSSAYTSYAISRTTPLSMTADADTWGTGSSAPAVANKWCPGDTTYTGNPAGSGGNVVRFPQQNATTLQGYIDGLTAIGATSINAGLKWGMTMIDPTMRSAYDTEIAASRMPATMDGRPLEYDAEDAMKVIVLMTDGENFEEERVNDGFKTGNSPIFQGNSDSRWSIFHESKVNSSTPTNLCNSRPYYVPHLSSNKWQSRPWNGTAPTTSACYVPNSTTGATQRTWPEVWAVYRVQYVAQYFYADASMGTTSEVTNMFRSRTSKADMNSQLQIACNAAKAEGVLIYGIAFEAPTNGQTQISGCATSASHYFNATGLQIQTAFRAIANNISQLRLTQ